MLLTKVNILLFQLDPATLLVTNCIGTMLMGLSLLVISRGYLKQIKDINQWATVTLLQSVGWCTIGILRGIIPDVASIAIGNGLVLFSLGIYYIIIKRFIGRTSNNIWVYVVLITAILLLIYFTLITPNVAYRTAIVAACAGGYSIATAINLLFFTKNKSASHILAGSVFMLSSIILIMRIYYSLFVDTDPNQAPFAPRTWQNISFLTFFLTSVMYSYCFSLMCNDQYIRQRNEAEQELIKAQKLTEQYAQAKDRFLSNMSHEIRTPLNGIIGFTNLLIQSDLPPKSKKQIELIKTSSDILMVLINDILDLAKINEGKMILDEHTFQPYQLINNIIATFKLQMEEKNHTLTIHYDNSIPETLIGDSIRVSQILINIINNSKKFTPANGKITISTRLIEQTPNNTIVQFTIADNGIGIAKEKLNVIFDPFVQDDTIHRHYEGTGLGLSIVKRLIGVMSGTISLNSELSKGTAVTITIPFKNSTTAVAPQTTDNTPLLTNRIGSLGHLNILLAEDNTINQLLAQTILQQYNIHVDIVDTGKKAIEFVIQNQYDIILMDLKMPEMGGFETTRHIRTQLSPPKSQVPIIAITADVTKADIDSYIQAGMNDYVLKPFNQADLLNKITQLVKAQYGIKQV